MSKTFEAEEKSIRNIFSENFSYEIPSYQRQYSWEKEEIEKFCEDIIKSYEEDEEYLLSSIILVEKSRKKIFEVIDGQQRLTTISLFLAVLKKFLSKEYNVDDINKRILNGYDVRVQRLKTDRSYHYDFNNILLNFDYDEIKEVLRKRDNKKNNYFKNSIHIYDYLKIKKDEGFDFDLFYEYFIDEIYLINVQTPDQSKAMRLFEVLNSRGLPLENSDLIKNHIMEHICQVYSEEDIQPSIESFEQKWKEISRELGVLNESVENLFTYYIYMKLGENPRNNLFEEFKKILKTNFQEGSKIDQFIRDFYNFYTKFIELFYDFSDIDLYRKINSMICLREGRFWKTILVSFKIHYPEENFKKLVDMIFEFYYLNYFSGESVNPYKQHSFNIIKKITQNNFSFQETQELFKDYYNRRDTIPRIKKYLNDEAYGEKWVRPFFYLIEYFFYMDAQDDYIFRVKNSKIQLEHILPENEINWKEVIERDPKASELKQYLGNLTLLFQKNNVKCSNYSFEKKKEIYSQTQKFEHTKEISNIFDKWDSETIKQRNNDLLNKFERLFDLESNILVVNE